MGAIWAIAILAHLFDPVDHRDGDGWVSFGLGVAATVAAAAFAACAWWAFNHVGVTIQ